MPAGEEGKAARGRKQQRDGHSNWIWHQQAALCSVWVGCRKEGASLAVIVQAVVVGVCWLLTVA